MRPPSLVAAFLLSALPLLAAGCFTGRPTVGARAPAFALASTAGGEVKLSDFPRRTVVLAFFPKAFTGG